MSADLIKLLVSEAQAERDRVLAEARRRAESILEEARREAQALLEDQRGRLESGLSASRIRSQSTAAVRASALVLQTKDEALSDVFNRAAERLERATNDRGRYRALLGSLIAEAAAGLEGDLTIEVHPRDRADAETIGRDLGLAAHVREDPSIPSGARVTSADGRFIVDNTLTARLNRARPVLTTEVARTLWG